jgi:hypothetical protein
MRPAHPLDYVPEVLGATAVVVGIVFRAWPLVSLGAGALGAPAIFVNGTPPSAPTERTNPMWRTKDERAEAKAARDAAEPFVPPEDTQVHDNQAPAQTAEEEDAIRGGRGERPTEEDE